MRPTRPRRRTSSSNVLPRALQLKIREAGASAYAWHDSELTAHLDPTGRWSRIGAIITKALGWAAALALTLFASQVSVAAGILAAGALGASALFAGFQRAHWVAWTVAGMSAMWPALAAGAGGNALAVALLVAAALATSEQRAVVLAAAGVAGGAAAWVLPESGAMLGWVAAGAVIVAAAAVFRVTGAPVMPQPWRRVKDSDVGALIPHPASRVPWLVQRLNRRGMAQVPQEIRRKQAGAVGERKTALMLLGMRRFRGTTIAHDVLIPTAETANADHVVLASSGLYIIDTKQFGREEDPGTMTRDPRTGEIVHESKQGRRSVMKSLETAAWAANSIAAALGVPGRARVILAVHRAHVAEGLSTMIDGVPVEVMPVAAAGARIDEGAPQLSKRELAAARFKLGWRLQAASGVLGPALAAPVGATEAARELMRAMTRDAQGGVAFVPAPVEPVVDLGPQGAADSFPVEAGAEEWRPAPVDLEPASAGAESSAVLVETTVQERLRDRWMQMQDSQPAPPDDVPEPVRGLWRGTPITVLVPTREGDVTSVDAVAMTGPCQGIKGSFAWFCTPEHYRIFRETQEPVAISTVSTERIMRRDQPSE